MSRLRRVVFTWLALATLLGVLSRVEGIHRGLRFAMAMLCLISNAPGAMLVGQTIGYLGLRTAAGYLASGLLTSLLAHLVLRWIERPGREGQAPPGAVTRRALLLAGGSAASGGFVIAYSHFVERRNFLIRPHQAWIPDLPAELEGLRLVLIADLHCGPLNRPADLRPAFVLANQCQPDLVLVPGDFVHYSDRYFDEAAELLSTLKTRIPGAVLSTWGNHDHWNGLQRGVERIPGVQLSGRRLVLTKRRELQQEGHGLWLCGVDDLWEGRPDVAVAVRGIPAAEPRIMLCHNPDVAEEQPGARVDLMVSGHTHGGQVVLPGGGPPIVPSRYGPKYASGFVRGPGYWVYTTRGLGVGGVPIRLGVPPEVTLLELKRGSQELRYQSLDYN